ncbi:hypothetical protein MY5147_005266 [Beauveria neobassiana]
MAAHRLRRLMFFPPVTGANQLTLLVLECTSKQDIFLPMYKALAPVETANLFSAVSFWWMNKLLLQGNKHIFQNEDMPPVYGRNDQPILTDIDMKLRYGSVTICCGSIGSGKSVLGKAILGELHAARDLVEVSSKRVGFCDQTPWIMAGTVKEVICAFASPVDEERYRAVVKACCLDLDLGQFQDGDALHIGSRGVNLSGGQKQRISLARLLYSGEAVVVLDDSFAALDGATESQVIQNLIGPAGWLRRNGVAVLWITNAAQYFRFADHVIMLENGRITHRGTAEQMRPFVSELRKFHAEDEAYPAHEAPARLAKTKAKKDAQNDLYRQTGDMSLYTFYFKSTGVVAPLAVVGATATYAVFNTVPTYWIKYWADREGSNTAIFAIGYVFIAFMA